MATVRNWDVGIRLARVRYMGDISNYLSGFINQVTSGGHIPTSLHVHCTHAYSYIYIWIYNNTPWINMCMRIYTYIHIYIYHIYMEKCDYCMSSMSTSSIRSCFPHLKGGGKPCQRLLPLALMSRCVDGLRSRWAVDYLKQKIRVEGYNYLILNVL